MSSRKSYSSSLVVLGGIFRLYASHTACRVHRYTGQELVRRTLLLDAPAVDHSRSVHPLSFPSPM